MLRKVIVSSFLLLTVSFGGVSIFPPSAYADHSILHTLRELQESIYGLQARVNVLATVLLAVKPDDVGKPADVGGPTDTGKPEDAGKPVNAGKSAESPASPAAPAGPPSESSGGGSNSSAANGGSGGGGGGGTAPAAPAQPVSGHPQAQAQIQDIQTKIQEIKNKLEEIQTQASVQLPPKALLARTLDRGDSGNDVKGTQEFLKHFPDIYPNGLATGNYGSATVGAVKKLQEKFGLSATGNIDERTKKKINELASAVERKSSPKISAIAPANSSVGATITLGGTGFTLEDNSLFVRGKIILTGLPSRDGTAIEFPLPQEIPCEVGQACPIKIINSNGVSNAKVFKLAESVPQLIPEPAPTPTQTPIPTPTPTPTPVSAPTVSLWSEMTTVIAGQPFTLTVDGTSDVGLAAVWWYGNNTGVATATVISSYPETSTSSAWFVTPVTNPTKLDRAFGSPLFSKEQAIRSYEFSSIVTIPTAGVYEFGANSRDVLYPVPGEPHQASEGAGLASLKITVVAPALPPSFEVISPNGGEAYKYGDAVTIMWKAENISSKSVNIRLLKGGVAVVTIASDVPQSDASGLFLYNWVIPSTLAVGSDYAIEVSDAAATSVKDASDGQFNVAYLAALKLLRPNEGEIVMRGFKIPIIWEYSASVPSAGITVNLYKGGIFQKTISTNLSHQGINGISNEDWQRYFQNKSPYPLFALLDVPDMPEGTDYALEIFNTANPLLRDVSDAAFPIITLPSPVTFTGRLIDRFTLAPIPNVQLGGYGTYTFMDGKTTNIAHPRTTTDANGRFSFSTTTDHLLNEVRSQALIGAWPACYNTGMASLYRDSRYPITTVNIVKDFSLQYLNSSATYKYFPLISPVQDWGDQLLWPMTQAKLYTDIPVKFGLEYQNNFGIFGGGGNSLYKLQHTLSTALPLDIDARVKLTDQAGAVYSSPFIRLPRDYGCAPKAISYMDGTFKWEPYPIGIGMSWTGGTVGTYTKATISAYTAAPYGGVASFTWKIIGGTLPTGMIFDPATATVSGVPTLAGTYAFDVRVTDTNGVRASATLPLTIR